MNFSELYRLLENNGWYLERSGKHHLYVHPVKKGKIPVGKHGSQEVATGTFNAILKMAGIKK